MGLLQVLGLNSRRAGAGATAKPSDALDARLGTELDALTAILDDIHDDATAAPLRAALQKVIDGRGAAQALAEGKRVIALNALIASVHKQRPVAEAARKRAQTFEARERARKEVDVTLGQVTALVLGGIDDDALRTPVDAELSKQKAAYDRVEKLADPTAARKAFDAMKPAALALLARGEKAKAVSDWLRDTWRPAAAKAREAVAAITTASARAALDGRISALEADAKGLAAKSDLATLQGTTGPALADVEKTARAITAAGPAIDAELKRLTAVVAAMGALGAGPNADALATLAQTKATTWPAGTTRDEIEASMAAYTASLKGVANAIDAQKKAWDERQAYEKARAPMQALLDAATAYHTASSSDLTPAQASAFANARKAVEDAVARQDWVAAKAGLPAWKAAADAVVQARDAKRSFDTAYAAFDADRAKVANALGAPGLPTGAQNAYQAAFSAVQKEITAHNWAGASAALPALKKALEGALKALKDGAKFYGVYASVRPDDLAADKALRETWDGQHENPKLSAAGAQYSHYHEVLSKHVAAGEWGDARDVLADLQIAARELVAEATRHLAARKPFDTALYALRRRWEAEQACENPPPPLATTAGAYKQQRKLVFAAVNRADFAGAQALLPDLQTAIDALMAAKDAQAAAATQFGTDWGALTGYAPAKQAAASKLPALAAASQAFDAADQAVEKARQVPDWVQAVAALPALQAAIDKLIADKGTANGAAKPEDFSAFEAKLKALEPRTSKASEATGVPFVETLQKTVRDRLDDVSGALTAKDLAGAEGGYARLLADLDAMEAGKSRYAAHKARFDATRAGDIAAALAAPLTPGALVTERAAAIVKTEAAIGALAGKGDTAAADAKLPLWVLEAKGWKEAQKAYAELHSGRVPSVSELEALAKKPGGEQALDELILNLSPTTPAKVLGACLKARFGFEVKRLDQMNADIQDLRGTKAHDPEQPDPELAAMYKLLAQIPSSRLKGKVTELVDFDANDEGGVYYGGSDKKIYTHSGRIGELADGEKRFGQAGEVMPKGEEVEEDCKPNPKAKPMPVSNHTLLHEVAHAEDDGIKFMEGRWDQPEFGGWRKESPDSIAAIAAARFNYDRKWIQHVLEDPGCKPPTDTPKVPKGVKPDVWEQRRQEALVWCEAIRAVNGLWWKGSVCQRVQIGGRVYQEAYDDGRWRSYLYAARSRGISGYQFRAPAEWFAELYAAYFGGKLKPSHPAMKWLVQFKPKETP